MKLSRKKTIELCIELWEWMAETGEEHKHRWPKWTEYFKLYGKALHNCWFCEYNERQFEQFETERDEGNCRYCPYNKLIDSDEYACEIFGSPYDDWLDSDTSEARKKYAKLFLAQIKSLK